MVQTKEEILIDAKNKVLGRLATEVARYLQGKHRRDYDPAIDFPVEVNLKNYDQIVFTGRKLDQKFFYHHTGYLGHLKEYRLKNVWRVQPLKVIQRAVGGMLPKNRLRQRRLKRIKLVKE
ncbi:MAG: 50S ribosomal protein L13 [Patescibacteria group bacterium]|nr:50S ribosomal protein L13 [Patescibacteria group bacterium]MCL5257846.1 50S ribosomal protein L13 [Patescibacteria group bacterium]